MNDTGGLLPPEFTYFLTLAAVVGFFSFIALATTAAYVVFKKIFGEELAKKYRWVFIVISVVLDFVFLFIYVFFFNRQPQTQSTN